MSVECRLFATALTAFVPAGIAFWSVGLEATSTRPQSSSTDLVLVPTAVEIDPGTDEDEEIHKEVVEAVPLESAKETSASRSSAPSPHNTRSGTVVENLTRLGTSILADLRTTVSSATLPEVLKPTKTPRPSRIPRTPRISRAPRAPRTSRIPRERTLLQRAAPALATAHNTLQTALYDGAVSGAGTGLMSFTVNSTYDAYLWRNGEISEEEFRRRMPLRAKNAALDGAGCAVGTAAAQLLLSGMPPAVFLCALGGQMLMSRFHAEVEGDSAAADAVKGADYDGVVSAEAGIVASDESMMVAEVVAKAGACAGAGAGALYCMVRESKWGKEGSKAAVVPEGSSASVWAGATKAGAPDSTTSPVAATVVLTAAIEGTGHAESPEPEYCTLSSCRRQMAPERQAPMGTVRLGTRVGRKAGLWLA